MAALLVQLLLLDVYSLEYRIELKPLCRLLDRS